MSSLFQIIALLSLVVFASTVQANFKIPAPLTIMGALLLVLVYVNKDLRVSNKEFDTIVLVTLPLLIATDALKLKWSDIKSNSLSLCWVSVVSVISSIGLGLLLNPYILGQYNLPLAALVMLFCMVAATDPITVSSVFSNFKVPHTLKVITEGESLFNDATALIIFSIALVALDKPNDVTATYVSMKTLAVIFGALGVGLVTGYLTTLLLRLSDDALVESAIILLGSYAAYYGAEKFHASGILSVIVAMVLTRSIIDSTPAAWSNRFFRHTMTNHENYTMLQKTFEFAALVASTALFASVAAIVQLDKLWFYKYEIMSVFIGSTVIRAVIMGKFSIVSSLVKQMHVIKSHWWAVLTLAGSKGAFSILMVHMLPNTFVHKELFEHVIVGVILLSTFLYAIGLALVFFVKRDAFAAEYIADSDD